MYRERGNWLLGLAVGIWVALAGCSTQAESGSAQLVGTLPRALSASDVVRVELTVSGAGMPTRTELLVKGGGAGQLMPGWALAEGGRPALPLPSFVLHATSRSPLAS
ncbi:hypothetical protein ACLESO_49890 [Pyxidicoccus sp. 3LG]